MNYLDNYLLKHILPFGYLSRGWNYLVLSTQPFGSTTGGVPVKLMLPFPSFI